VKRGEQRGSPLRAVLISLEDEFNDALRRQAEYGFYLPRAFRGEEDYPRFPARFRDSHRRFEPPPRYLPSYYDDYGYPSPIPILLGPEK